MTAIEFLKDYSLKFDPILSEIFRLEIERAEKISKYSTSPYEKVWEFSKGGKKVRGALTTLGYFALGGKDEQAIIKASVAIELIQSFLLIHDDFVDRDDLRRGKKTIHIQYKDELLNSLTVAEALHFGNSFAVFTGDIGAFMAWKVIAESDFPSDKKIEAMRSLTDFLILTADGELLDVREGFTPDLTFEDAYNARILKTAYYSVVMPLVFGARLAGAKDPQVEAMRGYGKSVGLAFQIQDDILGIFANSEQIGKNVVSDIYDGKKTVLYISAVNKADEDDKNFLLLNYGKGKISEEKVERIKDIFIKSGALNYAKEEAERLVADGKKFIPEITEAANYRELLSDLADFMIKREK